MHRSCPRADRVGKIYNLKHKRDVKCKQINSQRRRLTDRNGIRDMYFYIPGYENGPTLLLQVDVKMYISEKRNFMLWNMVPQ